MLKDNIHQMIADAMKNNEQDALKVYRLISAELTNAEKNGTKLDEATEAKILLKMATQHKDSIATTATIWLKAKPKNLTSSHNWHQSSPLRKM